MLEIRTEIPIDAGPAEVWATLMDSAHYGEWNPFVPAIAGEAIVGERLQVELTPPGGRGMRVSPRVLVVEPGQEFRWIGVIGGRAIMSGEHVFELHADGDGTRFVHWEGFRGLLSRPLMGVIGGKTQAGFVAMNEALKQRVETGAGLETPAPVRAPVLRAC